MPAEVTHFRQSQAQRLARFAATMSVDMHCHCLPGIDDGPATLAEALSLCRELVNDGITTCIATSHQLGPYEHVRAKSIRSGVEILQAELNNLHIPLTVLPGAEVRADDLFLQRFEAGDVLALGNSSYLLLELPHSTLIDLRPLIALLVDRNITPIISHPERQAALTRSPALMFPWLEHGALLQVTAGSLTGHFGPAVQRSAWEFVEAGWVSFIASDAHDVAQRAPQMTAAIDALASRLGHALVRRLCIANPQAIVENKPIQLPVLRNRFVGGRR